MSLSIPVCFDLMVYTSVYQSVCIYCMHCVWRLSLVIQLLSVNCKYFFMSHTINSPICFTQNTKRPNLFVGSSIRNSHLVWRYHFHLSICVFNLKRKLAKHNGRRSVFFFCQFTGRKFEMYLSSSWPMCSFCSP